MTKYELRLAKHFLQTGASMGIGEAIAESLSREGANVALLSRSEASREKNHSVPKTTLLTGYDRKNWLRSLRD